MSADDHMNIRESALVGHVAPYTRGNKTLQLAYLRQAKSLTSWDALAELVVIRFLLDGGEVTRTDSFNRDVTLSVNMTPPYMSESVRLTVTLSWVALIAEPKPDFVYVTANLIRRLLPRGPI